MQVFDRHKQGVVGDPFILLGEKVNERFGVVIDSSKSLSECLEPLGQCEVGGSLINASVVFVFPDFFFG